MASDEEIRSLRAVYEVWQSVPPLFEYGPLRAYAPAHQATMQTLWRDAVDPVVKAVAQSEVKTANGTYTARAPSPWHAYFYLRAQQQYVYRAGRPLGSPVSEVGPTGGEHLFFRGQRCSSWDFVSSLQRKNAAARAVEERAVVALTEYFRMFFVSNDDVASNTGRCFAQHYGIATDLADISCDPDIAIWFATHPFPASCPDADPNAVVRAVSWAGQQQGAETICLLPPPFVRNVYEQRGLFIDTLPTNGILHGNLTLQVEFPRDTAAGEFQVMRGTNKLAVWPPPDETENELVNWARAVAIEAADSGEVRSKVAQDKNRDALPGFWLERDLWDADKHIHGWLCMLDWVLPATCVTALPVSSGPQPVRYEILDLKVRALVRANPTFFIAFVEASQDNDFTHFQVLYEVLRVARGELGL